MLPNFRRHSKDFRIAYSMYLPNYRHVIFYLSIFFLVGYAHSVGLYLISIIYLQGLSRAKLSPTYPQVIHRLSTPYFLTKIEFSTALIIIIRYYIALEPSILYIFLDKTCGKVLY